MQHIDLDKTAVLKAIVNQLEIDLETQITAAKDAHDAATHAESVAETKWDTFGLESSYLAQGQQKRVEEIAGTLKVFRELSERTLPAFESVETNTLVFLENCYPNANTPERLFFFVGPVGGGIKVNCQDLTVTVITQLSPIGKQLKDKCEGDEVKVMHKGESLTFEIVEIA